MIETHDLSLRYHGVDVIQSLDLRVEEGSIHGLLGPLGAGKAAAMKLLAGLVPPSSGEGHVAGFDLLTQADAVRRHVGFLPDHVGSYLDMRVAELLNFFARLNHVPAEEIPPRRKRSLELAGLTDRAEATVEELDREQRRRLNVVKTLMHEPKVLLFNEPAIGLSMDARLRTRELIGRLRDLKKTILVSSNLLTDLVGLCDRIYLIDRGRIFGEGTAEAIAQQLEGAHVLEFETGRPAHLRRLLAARPDVLRAEVHGEHVLCQLRGLVLDPRMIAYGVAAQGADVQGWRELQIEFDLMRQAAEAPSDVEVNPG